ncbi:unnamed protein product [marine sediment metagenome]|uniref:ATPase F1/V1/A1 complex alpha/beta subunit N-terminal domain-containing protein n=1 Tax=marine sediment metagenome TaxID=412755 RepID=X1ADK7_9ZZZZ
MKKVYNRILQIAGDVITVEARDVGNQELAEITTFRGKSLAQVIRIEGEKVYLQVFAGSRGISTGDEVRFLGHRMEVSFSEDLLGRIFNGSGVPRDNGPALAENVIEIGGPSVNPAKRIIPRKMVRTGIPMIDIFNSLVVSQKLPIFSVAGEPYNEVLARIALQAEVDIIILGGMGLKYDDYLYFRDTLEKHGALSRAIFFVHTAADPTVECTMVPDMCLAVAEQFAIKGKAVLVLLTDMTNFADSLKEIAITMELVLQIMIVLSIRDFPVRGSINSGNSIKVSTTSPARSPQAAMMTISTSAFRLVICWRTVLPAPNGPGIQ